MLPRLSFLNLVERLPSKQNVACSSHAGRAIFFDLLLFKWLNKTDLHLTLVVTLCVPSRGSEVRMSSEALLFSLESNTFSHSGTGSISVFGPFGPTMALGEGSAYRIAIERSLQLGASEHTPRKLSCRDRSICVR
jgi:hypothetical protein